MKKDITLNVPVLARVEGEGALELAIKNQQITSLKLKIFEPPRLFEKFLEERNYSEVLDIVARICGICPVAYQMSAAHAIEQCFKTTISPWVREMRRLFYCGEWLESHSLHVHFLALPDFLGFQSAPEMAKKYPNEVRRGMRLQRFGNDLISLFGGRSVHPVGACVGGFFKSPYLSQIENSLTQARDRIADAESLIIWLASLTLPKSKDNFTSVSLAHSNEYPFNEGYIISDKGLKIAKEEFNNYFKEFQVPYSTALHCLLDNKPYLVGPLARMNNNFERLPKKIHDLLNTLDIHFPSQNMFDSIMARAIEIYFSILEAIRILENYQYNETPTVDVVVKAGEGYGCTEAPRGLLWHHYLFNDDGKVKSARIVPPTSQNQARIEQDLHISLNKFGLDKEEQLLRHYSESIIRNYDPCISCSTHFLTLKVNHQ